MVSLLQRTCWIAGPVLAWLALAFAGAAHQKPDATDGRIAGLVRQLGNKDYATRQYAQDQLAALGFRAHDALSAATTSEDLEIASRARYLLRLMWSSLTTAKDPPEVRELLQGYNLQPPESRLERIRALVQLPEGAGWPWVCRLICFENSAQVSNQAALELLNHQPLDKESQARLARIVRPSLSVSKRSTAKWLLAYLRLVENPKQSLAEWSRVVEAEVAAWKQTPARSDPGVAVALLYFLAEAQAAEGQTVQAQKTAQRARELCSGSEPAQLAMHYNTALALKRRGQFKWAEAEFRLVIQWGRPNVALLASTALAEMFHDQGDHRAAAEALQKGLEGVAQPKVREIEIAGRRITELRARMHYFLACHWREQGNQAKQVEHLETALRADPGEIDALIEYQHLPEATAEQRKRVAGMIARVTTLLRQQIHEDPDDANTYNQFAWLVGNTKGDLDEALHYAKRALELSPGNGAYLDTLAHVEFARGEYEQAVEHQTRAAQLEPHSALIAKKLQVFRAALEAKKQPARPTAKPAVLKGQ